MRTRLLLTFIVAALAATHLSAHDFWLAAVNWTPAAGTPVTITAGVGEKFPTRTNMRARANWLGQWRIIGAAGDVPVAKVFRRDNLVEATDVALPSPGAYLGVAMVSAQVIEMKADEFTEYLKEEGLEHIIAARTAAGEADKAAKEKYARYAKIALRNGPGAGTHLTRAVGVPAEFVPSSDPTSIRPGGSLTVQLLANGKPVSGAAISAVNGEKAARGQTDKDGRVTFTIDRPGAWLVKTVHMVRLPQTGTPEADWESFWVTLSFHTAS